MLVLGFWACWKSTCRSFTLCLAKVEGELALRPDPLAIEIEDDRERHQSQTQEGQQTRRPLRTEILVHVGGEKGEGGGDEAPDQCVGGEGRVRVEEVYVDKVDDGGHEDADDAGADEGPADDLGPGVDARV